MSIWHAYRERYPSLDSYLSTWMADYIHIYPCKADILALMKAAPVLSENGMNEALSRMAVTNLFTVPGWMLEELSQYKYTGSKFYWHGHQKLMDQAIPAAMDLLNQRMVEKTKTGILDTYASLRWHHDEVTAFIGAKAEQKPVYKINIRHYQNGANLRKYLRNAIRYTENLLREKEKFPSKLQGIFLDEFSIQALHSFIEDFYIIRKKNQKNDPAAEEESSLAEPGRQETTASFATAISEIADKKEASRQSTEPDRSNNPIPAESIYSAQLDRSKKSVNQSYINFEKVEQLRQESDDIRDALLSTVKQAEQKEQEMPRIERPAGTPEGLLTDLAPVQKILDGLSTSELNFLSLLRHNQWRVSRDHIARTYKKMMIDAIMDEINSLSMDYLGCFLLEEEGNDVVVAEDYRDELDFLTTQTSEKKKEWTFLSDGLEEEWISFFTSVDIDALAAILDGNAAFAEYARKQGKMPEVVRDTINSLAQDTIGDLLLNEEGIYEDYIELIQTHLIKE